MNAEQAELMNENDNLGLCPECNSVHRPSQRCKPW